ncbi:MAG: hypothetical protein DHS20C17_24410 [Cyclobacteriaceae bacterium]|nr:MAG: hypothetical protein DHS20C17_24410 [Cyclobacteriaceae bacterium]
MSLTKTQLDTYSKEGFLTVEKLFSLSEMDQAIKEAHQWQEEFLQDMSESDKKWYQDGTTAIPNQVRKLDNPVSQRPFFRRLALKPELISSVEVLIGKDVIAFFSQLFFKPPLGGGPKPSHQDNFYFGPDKDDNTVTAWIAFDDARVENGCLYYGKGSNHGGVIKHFAPENEPYNYQIADLQSIEMTAAPVEKGGVNFHHGNTVHRSSNNSSPTWRRAMAVHFMQKEVNLIAPIFEYDRSHFIEMF